MVSLILQAALDMQVGSNFVYFIILLEFLLVATRLLMMIFPEDSKTGKILRLVFRGLKDVRDKLPPVDEESKEEKQ